MLLMNSTNFFTPPSSNDVVEIGKVLRPHHHVGLISGTVGVCHSHLDDCARLDGRELKSVDEINHHWMPGFESRNG